MRWLIFIIIYTLIDLYAFQAIRSFSKSYWIAGIYFLISIFVIATLYFLMNSSGAANFMQPPRNYVFGIFLVIFIPKLILIIFMFGEDVMRFFT